MLTQGNSRSKVRDLIIHKTKENLAKTQKYMTHLRRDEFTSIFVIRSRMLRTKTKYTQLRPILHADGVAHPRIHIHTKNAQNLTINKLMGIDNDTTKGSESNNKQNTRNPITKPI